MRVQLCCQASVPLTVQVQTVANLLYQAVLSNFVHKHIWTKQTSRSGTLESACKVQCSYCCRQQLGTFPAFS